MLTILRMVVLLTLAAIGGLATAAWHNFPLVPDVRKLAAKMSCAEMARTELAIETAELQAHYSSGFLVIDARPHAEFEKGHLDCMNIMNIPPEEMAQNLDRLGNYMFQPIVIYCTSLKCELGEDLLCQLRDVGFIDLKLYPKGWEDGILKEGLPTAAGPEPYAADAVLEDEQTYTDGDSAQQPDETERGGIGDE